MKVMVMLLIPIACAGQAATRAAFEVASIKPSDPNPSSPMWTGMTADDGMVRYSKLTMKACIRAAYRVRDFQIQGPAWMEEARYQINAKLPAGASMEQIPEMMQSLLEERFRLTLRHDSKERAVYVTERPVVDQTGIEGLHKFELAFAPETMRGMPQGSPAPVSADVPAPSLFEAVQQYGLKLEARKVPVEMLVVTHVEKTPTAN